MNISLPPKLEQLVLEKIKRGDYDNADALVQEAVHRLLEEDEVDSGTLLSILMARDEEINCGESLELDGQTTKQLAEDVHQRGLRRLDDVRNSSSPG